MDPSLLTISQPLSAIAKTLLHCGAVMIALLSLGKNTGGGEEDDQRLCSWRFFITVRVIAVKLKPLNLKKKKYFKPNAAQTLQTTISMSMVI